MATHHKYLNIPCHVTMCIDILWPHTINISTHLNNCYGFLISDDRTRCSVVFINKGVTVSQTDVTIEWEGNGPGVIPADTADTFTCEVNNNPPRSCKQSALYTCHCFLPSLNSIPYTFPSKGYSLIL